MSAFIVSDKHISYLLKAALTSRNEFYFGGAIMTEQNKKDVGQMLLKENYKSVNFRYKDAEQPHDFEFSSVEKSYNPADPIQVLKAATCYEYQSCEHPEWVTSEAKAFIDSLKAHAIEKLPGYNDKKWSIL